jgi:methionyl-tRNA synthetase
VFEYLIDEGLFAQLLQRIFAGVSLLNGYVTEQKPWALAKDPARKERLDQVLYVLYEGLRLVAAQIWPFIPASADKMWRQLGFEKSIASHTFEDVATWGAMEPRPIVPGGILFPKFESLDKVQKKEDSAQS